VIRADGAPSAQVRTNLSSAQHGNSVTMSGAI
jgi:hypothetical protein